MSVLTFEDLRHASHAHLQRWGAWAQPAPRFEDQIEAPLPQRLIDVMGRFSPGKLAPVLAELVMQVDRLAATKGIDLAQAITTRISENSPELPAVLKDLKVEL